MSTNNDIEELFSSKFENYKVQTTDAEWMKLNSGLRRVNFMRFRPGSFNMYYLAGFVATVTLTAVLIITPKKSSSGVSPRNDSVEMAIPPVETDTLQPKTDTALYEGNSPVSPGMDLQHNIHPLPSQDATATDSVTKPSVTSQPPAATPVDSTTNKADNKSIQPAPVVPDTVSRQPRVRRIKKTMTVKTDAVIVRDTVNVNKKLR